MPSPEPQLDPERQARLDALTGDLQSWCLVWRLPQLPHHLDIRFSGRLRRTLGRCHPRQGRITLNGVLLLPENTDLLRETLCHEAAHVAAFHLHGPSRLPHGAEWRALIRAAGFRPRATIRAEHVPGLPDRRATGKRYGYLCPVCKTTATLRVNNPRLRCRQCLHAGRPGRLEILRLT